MVQVKIFPVNILEENTYVVFDETKEAVIIDCGTLVDAERKMVDDFIADNGLKVKYLLQTHAHFDHLFGADHIYKKYGVKPRMNPNDLSTYQKANEQMLMFMHRAFDLTLPPHDTDFLDADTVISFGSHQLRVFPTPGHTPGGICFYEATEHLLFSGDSLFRGSVGRTDLPGGNMLELLKALKHLLEILPEDTVVYPGHGPSTTIGDEKKYNNYIA